MGIVAIALDGGILLSERRHAQAVADAAALAAACDLNQNNGDAKAIASATAAVQANGYTLPPTVNIPPSSASIDHSGQAGYVEVYVYFDQSRIFSNIFASGSIRVGGRAVAGITQPNSGGASIIVLDATGSGALRISGTNLTAPAPVIVNSSDSQALSAQSGSLNAPQFDITGNYNLANGATLNGATRTYVSPTPDPLAYLAAPDPTQMALQSPSLLQFSWGEYTLNPGLYRGGLSVSGTARVYLNPGVYYFDGGGVTVGAGGSLNGSGVMLYNNPSSSGDAITINGSANVVLSPPTAGTYAGLTIFQKRSSSVAATVSGGTNINLTGTFYLAGATLNIVGSTSSYVAGSQYICKHLYLSGGGSLNLPSASYATAPLRTIRLVE
jgi:hypothetical protein